jgi:hypothetical protein
MQNRNASESGAQEFLQQSAARSSDDAADEIKSCEMAFEERPPVVTGDTPIANVTRKIRMKTLENLI